MMYKFISSFFSKFKLKKKKYLIILSFFIFFLPIIIFFSGSDTPKVNKHKDQPKIQKVQEKQKIIEINTPDKTQSNKNESKLDATKRKKDTKAIETTSKKKIISEEKKKIKPKTTSTINDPQNTVNQLHEGLKKISNDDLNQVSDLINKTYNIEKMIAMIIGDIWEKMNKEIKKKLLKVFQEYIAKNYIRRFKKIKNFELKSIKKKKFGNKYTLVKTKLIVDKSDEVLINYLLGIKEGKWKIFDVLLAGSISEIATKKSEFRKFLKDEKIDDLINALEKKNIQLND